MLNQWPTDVAESNIWDKDIRQSLIEKKISEYALNQRREQNLIPGTKLKATAEDAQIPILLVQRGGPAFDKAGISQKPLASHELIEGWTVILPRGWGMAFWKSLVFAGVRVAGYDDVRAMHFESGLPCFPHDYPGTCAFETQRKLTKESAMAVWEKRPPGKRVNFTKRGVDHPFESAFETLSDAMEIDSTNRANLATRPSYDLLQGHALVSTVISNPSALTTKLQQWNRLSHPSKELNTLDEALVKIRIKYIDRGKPAPHAMVYLLASQEEYNACTYHLRRSTPVKQSKRKLKELLQVETHGADYSLKMPSKSHHIGYITNGDFSLTLGYGFGIGACHVKGLQKMNEIDTL